MYRTVKFINYPTNIIPGFTNPFVMDALGPYYTLIATNKMELKTLQKIPETQ